MLRLKIRLADYQHIPSASSLDNNVHPILPGIQQSNSYTSLTPTLDNQYHNIRAPLERVRARRVDYHLCCLLRALVHAGAYQIALQYQIVDFGKHSIVCSVNAASEAPGTAFVNRIPPPEESEVRPGQIRALLMPRDFAILQIAYHEVGGVISMGRANLHV